MSQAATSIAAPRPARSLRPWARRAGGLLSGLFVLFFLVDGAMKLALLQPVIDTMQQLGWPVDPALLRFLGAVMIVLAALYAYPPTAVLGAVLISAYLGGAVATHARIGSPLFSHVLFGVYVGVIAWAGLWLRRPDLRAVMFSRRPATGAGSPDP